MISAHNLPKPQGSGAKGEVIDPYVVLELHGVPADCAEQRTRTAAQNQDDPLFDETFEFQVSYPKLLLGVTPAVFAVKVSANQMKNVHELLHLLRYSH